MSTPLDEFAELSRKRPSVLRQAHEQGTKIIAYQGNYVPTELIYAAGAKPYALWRAGEPEPVDAALEETLRFLNPLHRTAIGMVIMGIDPVIPFADMFAASITDAHMARIAEIFEDRNIEVYKVGVPCEWQSDLDMNYYAAKIAQFKTALEKLTGNTITDEALRKQIGYTNQIRNLLRKIDELRKLPAPPISGTDFLKLNHYVVQVEPQEAIEHLTAVYAWLQSIADENATDDRARIMLCGHAVGIGDYLVVKTLEDAGAVVVTELLDEAYYRFATDIAESDDPVRAIAENAYRGFTPIDNFQPAWDIRFDHIKNAMAKYQCDGVLWYQLIYDEIYDMEYCVFSKNAAAEGLMFSNVQTSYEYTREAMGPLTTKLETIVETFKGGR